MKNVPGGKLTAAGFTFLFVLIFVAIGAHDLSRLQLALAGLAVNFDHKLKNMWNGIIDFLKNFNVIPLTVYLNNIPSASEAFDLTTNIFACYTCSIE